GIRHDGIPVTSRPPRTQRLVRPRVTWATPTRAGRRNPRPQQPKPQHPTQSRPPGRGDGRPRRLQLVELPTPFPDGRLELQAAFFLRRKQREKLFTYYLVIRSLTRPERTECPILVGRGVCEPRELGVGAPRSLLALPAYWLFGKGIEPSQALDRLPRQTVTSTSAVGSPVLVAHCLRSGSAAPPF